MKRLQAITKTIEIPFGDPSWHNSPSIYFKDTHHEFRKKVRAWVDKELMPNVSEWEANEDYPMELHKKFYEAGLLGSIWPEKYGGTPPKDFDMFHELILWDELARSSSACLCVEVKTGMVWALAGIPVIALTPILLSGSEEIKKKIAPKVIKGETIVALAVTEPYAGSDVANIKTTAKKEGDYYIVNGVKKFITASYYTTLVRTGGKGAGGLSLLLIDRNTPGIHCKKMKPQGFNTTGTALISFNDVKVPASNLIGKEGTGFKTIMLNFNHERFVFISIALRGARLCLEEAIKYARQRETFGKKLIEHQVIRHKMAEMARLVESTQAWVEALTYQMTIGCEPKKLGGLMALCKVQTTKVFELCAREASQVLGGASCIRGGVGEKVERLYREVRVAAIAGGSEEVLIDLFCKQSKL